MNIRHSCYAGIQPTCFSAISAYAGCLTVAEIQMYYIYLLANNRNGTLYIGVTNNLVRRIYEHKSNLIKGFSNTYDVHKLVYFESHSNPVDAITREKQIKRWKRKWKSELIEEMNPD